MAIEIFRGNDLVATIPVGPNLTFSHGLMNQHKIVASDLKGFDPLSVQIEDYIIYKGVKFKINTVPQIKADHQLTYEITFEGPKYTWHDKLFMHEGAAEFYNYGNALSFMQLFLVNINEIDPGWTLGVVEATNEKHLTFSNITCHEGIILIAEAFGLEYDSDDKVITMIPKIGRDTGLVFEYGMGKGLYEISRSYVSNKNVVTKVYGFGGSRNLPVGYRGIKKRLTFDPGYKAKNTDLYGIKEGQYTNDDIYPQRIATATAVSNVGGVFKITDTTLDFDINNLRLSNELDPKISFIDGRLAGEEFVITKYDHATKTITYKGFVNSNNFPVPGETNIANVGDKYILHDIKMPDTYVKAAELRVDQETEKYALENSVPKVEYTGTIDPLHLRDNQIVLKPGDRVNFKDGRIGLNDTIRITEISYPLDFPDFVSSDTKIEIKIANFVTYSAQQRLRDEKLIVRHEVKEIDLRSVEQARRNAANLLNLQDLVIDPDGNYYTSKIKPGSIETLYLSVGAKATNFSLKNVAFKVNSGGNPSIFTATAGQLVHFGINIPGAGFVWEMQPFSITGLSDTATYYLYAKVSRVTLVGSWELSTDIRTYESVPGFFSLQTGVLFPVQDGYRNYELTKGMAFMVGDQITAGVLKSLDGQNFFDLTDGKFKLGDANYGLDWNVTTPNRLTLRGGLTQNPGGVTAPITLFRGAYLSATTYYKGDQVTYNGSSWTYIYPTPVSNILPTEGSYWTIAAQSGQHGPLPAGGGEYEPTKEYTGNSIKVDIVRYNDGSGEKAYVARVDAGTFSGILPTNMARWRALGGQYESLATDLFFAKLAFIKNLGVENLKTSESGTRVEITKAGNNMSMYVGSSITPSVKIDAKINLNNDSQSAGMAIYANGDTSNVTAGGMFVNGSSESLFSSASGIVTNGSIMGMLKKKNQTTLGNGYSGAIMGWDATDSDTAGNSGTYAIMSWGGFYISGRKTLDIIRPNTAAAANPLGYFLVTNQMGYIRPDNFAAAGIGNTVPLRLPKGREGEIIEIESNSSYAVKIETVQSTNTILEPRDTSKPRQAYLAHLPTGFYYTLMYYKIDRTNPLDSWGEWRLVKKTPLMNHLDWSIYQ